MIKGLVSIVIPTYNRANYVVEAIQSAKSQTYSATEIIVIDDGSSDDTARRVAEIDGVEYRYQNNKGQGAARNYGLSLAQGEYIASLDSDDLWESDFLAQSVACLKTFELDFVFTNWDKVRQGQLYPSEWLRDGKSNRFQTNSQGEWFLLTPVQLKKMFLDHCPAPSSSMLVRRTSIGAGWGEHMLIADDWYFLLDMVLNLQCRAAFSMTPRWKKRVDGKNVYDGQTSAETLRNLYLHDQRMFRKDFRARLNRRERLKLVQRELIFRVFLALRFAINNEFGARVKKVAAINAPLRMIARWMMS